MMLNLFVYVTWVMIMLNVLSVTLFQEATLFVIQNAAKPTRISYPPRMNGVL